MLKEVVFTAIDIARVGVDDVATRVDHEGVGHLLHTHGTAERAVGIEQHFKGPALRLDKGGHGLRVLGFVDGDGHEAYTCGLLPVVVDLGNGVQLTQAGFAPCGEEGNDERSVATVEGVGGHGAASEIVEHDIGQLGMSSETHDKEGQCHQKLFEHSYKGY